MTLQKEFYEKQAKTILKHLEMRNMEGYYCSDSAAAVTLAMSLIPEHASVAWGGSATLEESGMMKALQESSRPLIDRDKAANAEEKKALQLQAFAADYYLMSCNAITFDGQLVNVDGSGNRVAALIYGPEHVILLVGMNKVAKDLDAALLRLRTQAAPLNAMRLKMNTPCGITGSCANCLSPDCICSQTVTIRYNRTPGRIKVLLIGETLGF